MQRNAIQRNLHQSNNSETSIEPLSPRRHRLGPRPNWRERRRLRSTSEYRQVQDGLGTSDADTLLLLRVGELQIVEAGQPIPRDLWSRSHVVVGLSARLALGAFTEVTAPWRIDETGPGAEISASQPGMVLLIDRRHLHLVESALAGRVEPVAPIARALKYPPPRPAEQRNRAGSTARKHRSSTEHLVRAALGASSN